MGCTSDSSPNRKKKKGEYDGENKFTCLFTKEQLKIKLDKFFDNAEIIKDISLNQNCDSDSTFTQLRIYEEEKLTQYFFSKKNEFCEIILDYFLRNNLSQIPQNILDRLIEIEKAYAFYEKKVKNEIEKINEDRKQFNIEYLTIMLVGKSGVGKSTLINKFLKLTGNKRAKTGTGQYQTIATDAYKSKEVSFFRLVDTRGIELNQGFGAEEVKAAAQKFIQEQLDEGNMNNFVHCIWYCITGTRFEQAEIDLLNKLRESYEDNNIPIIIVYTQATDDEAQERMKQYIKEKKIKGDFIEVLAERKKINGNYIEAFNLDILLQETLNKCRKALKGEMNSIMNRNIGLHLKDLMTKENEAISNFIHEKIIIDFIEKEKYILKPKNQFNIYIINNFFRKTINYFLDKNMSESSSNILKSELSKIRQQNDNYVEFYEIQINLLIKNDLSNLAYNFLDNQAIKEKETTKNILNKNRRTHKEFCETSKRFLEDNFNYISQILYIKHLINNNYFTDNLNEKLNQIIESILIKNDIKKLISNCFLKKFEQFENEIKKKSPDLINKMNKKVNESNKVKKTNKTKKSISDIEKNEDDLPAAMEVGDFPDKNEINDSDNNDIDSFFRDKVKNTENKGADNSDMSFEIKEKKIEKSSFLKNEEKELNENLNKNKYGFFMYEGEFKDKKKHGKGTMLYPNGNKYIGEWKNDIREGHGKMIFATGESLEGEFHDNVVFGEVYIAFNSISIGEITICEGRKLNMHIINVDNFDIQKFIKNYLLNEKEEKGKKDEKEED